VSAAGRFRIAEDSGRAEVDLTYSYVVRNGGVGGEATASFQHARAGNVYGITLPPDAAKGAPSSFRFCVQAADGSANIGKRSCARFHVLPPKKKRS
jgi:hypothetical protein